MTINKSKKRNVKKNNTNQNKTKKKIYNDNTSTNFGTLFSEKIHEKVQDIESKNRLNYSDLMILPGMLHLPLVHAVAREGILVGA